MEAVTESASAYPGARVKEVRLRVGALASVVEDSLQFCWELATEGSPLAGAKLGDQHAAGDRALRCLRLRISRSTACRVSAARAAASWRPIFRQGRELEIESIELEEPDARCAGVGAPKPVEEQTMTTRIVELRRGILKKNDELAAGLRERFTSAGVLVLNLVSSPGTGKTAFLERTLRELRARGAQAAALVGDLETDNDARRLAASGAPVRQINTHGICHLDAEMIAQASRGLGGRLARRARLSLHRKCRQPGLPVQLRPGRAHPRRAAQRDRRRGQAAQVSGALQLRRRGGDHQDRPRRSLRIRSRAGAQKHQRNPPRHPHLRDLRQNRRGDGRVARIPRRAGPTLPELVAPTREHCCTLAPSRVAHSSPQAVPFS